VASKKVIKIKCEGTQYVDFHKLNEFQEDIKQSSREDLDKLKEEIKKAFKLPFSLWKNKEKWWILDGHQRKKALTELEKEGWCVPLLPAVEIKAGTKAEAKKNVLLFISQTGEVDKDKLKIYVEQYKIELKNIVIRHKEMEIEPIRLNIIENTGLIGTDQKSKYLQNRMMIKVGDIEFFLKKKDYPEFKIFYKANNQEKIKTLIIKYLKRIVNEVCINRTKKK
jgi:hypothetical protein